MSRSPALVESRDGAAVVGISRCRAHKEELVKRHLAVERIPSGHLKRLLDVLWHIHLGRGDAAREAGCKAVHHREDALDEIGLLDLPGGVLELVGRNSTVK